MLFAMTGCPLRARPSFLRLDRTRSLTIMASQSSKAKVVVTGAGGRTGKLVMKTLLDGEEYQPIGMVRSEKSAAQLREWGASDDQIVVGDVLSEGGVEALAGALAGAAGLIVCTSGVPQIIKRSLVPVLLAKLFRREGVRPKFRFKGGQMPEQVDWEGQKAQVDAALAAGVGKVVVCGSMGGTDRANFLNTIGGWLPLVHGAAACESRGGCSAVTAQLANFGADLQVTATSCFGSAGRSGT